MSHLEYLREQAARHDRAVEENPHRLLVNVFDADGCAIVVAINHFEDGPEEGFRGDWAAYLGTYPHNVALPDQLIGVAREGKKLSARQIATFWAFSELPYRE